MNLNKLKKLYVKAPFFVKKIYALIPFKYRQGLEYRNWRKYLDEQKPSLKRNPNDVVKKAFENFAFYKSFYHHIDLQDWERIPLLEKNKIQESLDEFENYEVSKFYVTTGGVTGKPAKFFQSKNVWAKEMAFVYYFFKMNGYKPTIKKVSFRGGDFSNLKNDRFWKHNPNNNEVHFSPFHLNKETVYEYVSELNKIKPSYFHGYPSSFLTLAKLMSKEGLQLNYKPNAFFLISEGYNRKDILFLESFFNCKMKSFYGHSERLVFAVGDETLENYTPNLDYGYMELVDENGKVIKENDILGEIVGTSYDNEAMPLIRYKTGDYTSYTDYSTKTFGSIQGKWGQTVLFGRGGEEITLTALNLHSQELDDVLRLQFIQVSNGVIKLLIMFTIEKNETEIKVIENLLSSRVGNLIHFAITVTDNFILNKRGKSSLIINENK